MCVCGLQFTHEMFDSSMHQYLVGTQVAMCNVSGFRVSRWLNFSQLERASIFGQFLPVAVQ